MHKPPITVTESDQDRLSRLAESHSVSNRTVADELMAELARAEVIADEQLAPDVVRMGSSLRFTTDVGHDRSVALVFPGEADVGLGKISILTPIGVALIGLSTGQSIDWTARDGQTHRLKVERVEPPQFAFGQTNSEQGRRVS
jgi:regulator of nucleoside diphosphate kinase